MPYPFFGLVEPPASVADHPAGGRRLRVLVRLANANDPSLFELGKSRLDLLASMEGAEKLRALADPHGAYPLRISGYPQEVTTEPTGVYIGRDAQLHPALRDLAYEILEDLQEACAAFDNPDVWYPGVDDGIEPVPDDNVRLVTWATQRELDRERRLPRTGDSLDPLPPVPLADLPWRIQRAFAERRRLRYQQWGIGRTQWEENNWSLWGIPLDPEYRSRREARGLREENDSRIWP
jgi:hypothetical protein